MYGLKALKKGCSPWRTHFQNAHFSTWCSMGWLLAWLSSYFVLHIETTAREEGPKYEIKVCIKSLAWNIAHMPLFWFSGQCVSRMTVFDIYEFKIFMNLRIDHQLLSLETCLDVPVSVPASVLASRCLPGMDFLPCPPQMVDWIK